MTLQPIRQPLDPQDAAWFWLPGDTGPNSFVWLDACLDHGSDILEGRLLLSADTSYKLWINDRFVAMGPAREAPPFFYYDVLDPLPLLREGRNTLRILAHYQGAPSQSYSPGTAGVLIKGDVTYRDGHQIDLGDPGCWRCFPAVEYQRHQHRLGHCIGFAEHFSARTSGGGPRTAGAEGRPPVVVGRFPEGPRHIALARDLPFLAEYPMAPAARNLTEDGCLVDFGQEVFGFVSVRGHAPEPVAFEVAYGEHLTAGQVDHAKAGMDYRDRLTFPAGLFAWTSYEKRALRYLHVKGPADSITDIRVIEYRYPYRRQPCSPASGSQAALKRRIIDVSARTIELCSDDLLNDCPWRERAQYLDPYTYFGAMKKLFGTLAPARRFLRQFARGAEQQGRLPMCYPSGPSTTVIPDFTLGYVCALREYADLSGDLETVKTCFTTVRAVLDNIRQYEDARGLLTDVQGWVFLDNSFELCRAPRSSALNALYAGALNNAADLAEHLGLPAETGHYRRMYARLRHAWRETFFSGGQLLDSDASPAFAHRSYLNYHYPADQGSWEGGSFVLRFTLNAPWAGIRPVYLSFFNGCRVWIDHQLVFERSKGGDWGRPPLFSPALLDVEGGSPRPWHVEIQHSPIDWEVFIGAEVPLSPTHTAVTVMDRHGDFAPGQNQSESWIQTRLRPYSIPALSHVSVAHAALWGLLDDTESRRLLRACLPTRYHAPYRKRTTPFFVTVSDTDKHRTGTVLPCNTPWSLFFLSKALKRHDMTGELESLLLSVYGQELALGASTWWEEWGSNSSLCHAWGAFVADFLIK